MKSRQYIIEGEFIADQHDLFLTDDQMRSLVQQFKTVIASETGKTDDAVGTNTESVDDAHDDMGNPGIKFSKS